MIKLKNREEFLIDLSVPGTQTAAVNKRTFLVPFACRLKAIYATLGTAGTTGSQIIDINKNSTTIWNTATKLTFATAVTAATYDAFATDPTTFAKGDYISVDVDSIHSGVAAVNLNLVIVLQRLKASPPKQTITDSIGVENE